MGIVMVGRRGAARARRRRRRIEGRRPRGGRALLLSRVSRGGDEGCCFWFHGRLSSVAFLLIYITIVSGRMSACEGFTFSWSVRGVLLVLDIGESVEGREKEIDRGVAEEE